MSARCFAAILVMWAPAARGGEPDFKLEGVLGTLDGGAVQAAVERASPAISACHDEHALRYVGGTARVKMRVARDGKIAKAFVEAGDLGSWETEKCLIGVARGMSFGKPKGGEAEVVLPLDLPARSPAALGDSAELDGKLAALARCGRASGTQVTVYVGPGGKVTSAGFAGEVSEGWGDCAVAKARAWKLTDPRGQVTKLVGQLP